MLVVTGLCYALALVQAGAAAAELNLESAIPIVRHGRDATTLTASCDTLYNPGCTECAGNQCAAVDTGFFLKANANGVVVSERCESFFGAACTACTEAGCTATLKGYFPLFNANNGVVEAAACSDFKGSNCAECNADKCTALISPEVGTICNNQGIYCLDVNSQWATCTCSNNVPIASTWLTAKSYVDPQTKKTRTCKDGYGAGCNNCNSSCCTAAELNYALPAGACLPVPCGEVFGAKCAYCNNTACLQPKDGWTAINANGMAVPCAQVTGEGSSSCQPVWSVSQNLWECTGANRGYYCGKQEGEVARRSRPCPANCAACDTKGLCLEAAPGYCLNSVNSLVNLNPSRARRAAFVDTALDMCQDTTAECTFKITGHGGSALDVKSEFYININQANYAGDVYIRFKANTGTPCTSDPYLLAQYGRNGPFVIPSCNQDCVGKRNESTCWSMPFLVSLERRVSGPGGVEYTPLTTDCPVTVNPCLSTRRRDAASYGPGGFATFSNTEEDTCKNNGGIWSGKDCIGCVDPTYEWNKHLNMCELKEMPKSCKTVDDLYSLCGNNVKGCTETANGQNAQIVCKCTDGIDRYGGTQACDTNGVVVGSAVCYEHGQGVVKNSTWKAYCDATTWTDAKNGLLMPESTNSEWVLNKTGVEKFFGTFLTENNLDATPMCWQGENRKACYCHRTCDKKADGTYKYVPVPATINSDHCEAVGVFHTDKCCNVNGTCDDIDIVPPNPVNPPITFEVFATHQCCPDSRTSQSNGCITTNCGGDPHFQIGHGTYIEAFQKNLHARLLEYLVFDHVTGKHELVLINSKFTSTGMTWMSEISVEMAGRVAKYVFGASGAQPEGVMHTDDGVVDMLGQGGYAEVADDEGNLVFTIRYNAGKREHTIRLARDPHMTLYVKNTSREMRLMLQKANALARYEWVATAGVLGFNTPRPFNDWAMTELDRRQRRARDLIDRSKWNTFVQSCQASESDAPCDVTPLTTISTPLVYYNNQPVGPADSTFLGWADVNEYGINNILGAESWMFLKNAGAQRCYACEFVMQWAVEMPTEYWRVFADEHLSQCAQVKSSAIDALYSVVPGYQPAPRRRDANENGNNGKGNGNNGNNGKNLDKKLEKAAARGVDALTKNCPVSSDGMVRCNSVLYIGGSEPVLIEQAEDVVSQDFKNGKAPKGKASVKAVIKAFRSNECITLDQDRNVESTSACTPGMKAKTSKVVIAKDTGIDVTVSAAVVDDMYNEIAAHYANAHRRRRQTTGATNPAAAAEAAAREIANQDGCVTDSLAKVYDFAAGVTSKVPSNHHLNCLTPSDF